MTVGVPTCGNGIREFSTQELCDDRNLNNGDGCNDVCSLEPLAVLNTPGLGTFNGDLGSPLPQWYRINLSTAGYLDAALYAPTPGRCDAGFTGTLELYADDLTPLSAAGNAASGVCARFHPALDTVSTLPAGTYWLRVLGTPPVTWTSMP